MFRPERSLLKWLHMDPLGFYVIYSQFTFFSGELQSFSMLREKNTAKLSAVKDRSAAAPAVSAAEDRSGCRVAGGCCEWSDGRCCSERAVGPTEPALWGC